MYSRARSRAFTLVELVVTLAIIAILSGITAVSYSGVLTRARDADRKNDLAQMKLSLANYYSAQISPLYPVATTTITLNNSNDAVTTALKPGYIRDIPLDPKNTGSYFYKYRSLANASGTANRDYILYATLENTNDRAGWGGGSAWVADGYTLKPDF